MNVTENLLIAAVSGALLGATGCASTQAPSEGPSAMSEESMGGMQPGSDAKHACKGQNECKGQGGCKTDKNACKGQNECKGQGGCKTA